MFEMRKNKPIFMKVAYEQLKKVQEKEQEEKYIIFRT